MNQDKQEQLEALLRGQPLRQPSPKLDQRLSESWSRPVSVRKRRAAWAAAGAAVLAVAAAVIFMVLPHWPGRAIVPHLPDISGNVAATPPAEPTPANPAPKAAGIPGGHLVRIERAWCTPEESKVVMVGDAPPVRHERRQVVRDVRVVDDRQHVSIEWTVSSDETAVVPLEIN